MTTLKILIIPDDRLRKIASPVKKISMETMHIIDNMFDTMYTENGIGLAATQVNIHQQIIVIDISKNHEERFVLINPKLIQKKGMISTEEGCLSIPKQRALVPRFKEIKIQALDCHGRVFELEASGLLSICIQHEMDHLIGKLFIDYLSLSARRRIIHNIEKLGYMSVHENN